MTDAGEDSAEADTTSRGSLPPPPAHCIAVPFVV